MRILNVLFVTLAVFGTSVSCDGSSSSSSVSYSGSGSASAEDEAALAIAAGGQMQGSSSHQIVKEFTVKTSQETVKTIEYHIEIDEKVVIHEKTTVDLKEKEIEKLRREGKSESDSTLKIYVKEHHEASARWFAARRRILEAKLTISVHIHRWGSAIHSRYVSDMNSVYTDMVQFNTDVDSFLHTIGHGIVKIGEVTLGTLVFAGVEAWKFGGKVVHTSEDAWTAIAADAKSTWISFGLHIELFWNTVVTNVRNTVNNVQNKVHSWESTISDKWHGAVSGWSHGTDTKKDVTIVNQHCDCPSVPDCPTPEQPQPPQPHKHRPVHHDKPTPEQPNPETPTDDTPEQPQNDEPTKPDDNNGTIKADSVDDDQAAVHSSSHRRAHKNSHSGVHVEVSVD